MTPASQVGVPLGPMISALSQVLGSRKLTLNTGRQRTCPLSGSWKPGTTQREPGSWVKIYEDALSRDKLNTGSVGRQAPR